MQSRARKTKARLQKVGLLAVACILVGGYFFWSPGNDAGSAPPVTAEIDANANAPNHANVQQAAGTSVDEKSPPQKTYTVNDTTPITPEQWAITNSTLNTIRQRLQDAERTQIIEERDIRNFRETLLEVLPLDLSAIESAHAGISEGLKRLPRNSRAGKNMEQMGLALIDEYTKKPRKHKVLRIRVPTEPGGKVVFHEYYVNAIESVKSDEDGRYHLILGDGPDSQIIRDDINYIARESWAGKRYGHLIGIDR